MKTNSQLNEKLEISIENLDRLTTQLRETRDYSENSELTFLLRELVLEQITTGNNDKKNENTGHTAI